MHIEFAWVLRELLTIAAAECGGPLGASAGVLARHPLSVTDCPPKHEGVVGSDLPLRLCKQWRATNHGPSGPWQVTDVAKQLAAFATALSPAARDKFCLHLAPTGHINASPLPPFWESLLRAVDERGPKCLFQEESLEGNCPGEPLMEPPGWTASPLCSSALIEFAKSCFARDLLKEGLDYLQEPDPGQSERVLLALAMMADKDIDPDYYRAGIKCVDNVPWQLESVVKHARRLCNKISPPVMSREAHVPEADAWAHAFSGATVLCRATREGAALLGGFRGQWWMSKRGNAPHLAVAYLRQISRWFFSYYNRPEFREPGFFAAPPGGLFLKIARALAEVVQVARHSIPRECQRALTVSHRGETAGLGA